MYIVNIILSYIKLTLLLYIYILKIYMNKILYFTRKKYMINLFIYIYIYKIHINKINLKNMINLFKFLIMYIF